MANIGLILAAAFIIIGSIVYWKKIHKPRQEAKRLAVIKKFIHNGKVKGDAEDYEVEEDTPLWYIASIFASHTKKGGKKRDLAPVMTQLVEKEFPESFEKGAEKTLMGMCLELAEHGYHDILSMLSDAISSKMSEQKFTLKLKDNDFRMRCWKLSSLIVKKDRFPGDVVSQRDRVADQIKELYTKEHLQEEFVPYLSKVLYNTWNDASRGKEWISALFQPFDLEYKMYFLKELRQISHSYEKISLFDAIVSTIKLTTIAERPEEEWEEIIGSLVALGYATRLLGLNTDGVKKLPLKQRIALACKIQSHKKKLDGEDAFTSLLFVDEKDYKKFYDLKLPESITTYLMNDLKKSKLASVLKGSPFIQLNRYMILNTLLSYQKGEINQGIMMEIVRRLPDVIQDKIHAKPETRSIFRYVISTVLVQQLKDNKYDKVIQYLKLYRAPYDRIVDVVEKTINQALVTHGNEKNLQQFLLTLQSELLESDTDKKSVRKIGDWLKRWSLIFKTTKGAQQKDAYIAGLLDVIKETKGEFEPRAITDQVLTLLTADFENTVRIFKSGGIVNNLQYQTRTADAKARLESVKHAYYKLQLLADNQDLSLSDEDRKYMRKVSQEVLAFVINIRRQDFLERMDHVAVGLAEVIDPGALLQKTFGNSNFVTMPESFHTFALPAIIVLNEFLTNPIRIPFVGTKQEGVLVNPMFWVFGAAVNLALAPIMAHTESTYSDYFILEYLKTTALAVKKAEKSISMLLAKIDANLTPNNLLVKSFKQLMNYHHLQGIITREIVIKALEFGGWDVTLADKIIEDKDYCIYCSFELPKDAKVCTNCERPVKEFDLASIAPEEIEVDLSQLGMDVSEAGPGDAPPGGGGMEVE